MLLIISGAFVQQYGKVTTIIVIIQIKFPIPSTIYVLFRFVKHPQPPVSPNKTKNLEKIDINKSVIHVPQAQQANPEGLYISTPGNKTKRSGIISPGEYGITC